MKKFVELYPKVRTNRTREIMDMFLFSFHACGLRISDIATLEWSHIDFEKRRMEKKLVKGKNFHEIRLNDEAIAILRKWGQRSITVDSSLIFYQRISSSLHQRNQRGVILMLKNQIELLSLLYSLRIGVSRLY